MANYRQTNHSGRVSEKSGSVYNHNHKDRMFDLGHAENINVDMTKYNINIHYDAHNNATIIDANDANPKNIFTIILDIPSYSTSGPFFIKWRWIMLHCFFI